MFCDPFWLLKSVVDGGRRVDERGEVRCAEVPHYREAGPKTWTCRAGLNGTGLPPCHSELAANSENGRGENPGGRTPYY